MTRFKELCLDTATEDGEALGRFWAAATGGRYARTPGYAGGDVHGDVEGAGIAVCPVPEPKTVKHRVHLDVHTDSVQTLLDAGATVAPAPFNQSPGDQGWTVLLDPEGGELCAFVREDVPAYRGYELVVDSVDAEAITRWWAGVLGVTPHNEGQTWWWLTDVPGVPFESWLFDAAISEPKTVKNRLHWDVYGDADELVARGATKLWEMPRWIVLADPEGNEFCVFPE